MKPFLKWAGGKFKIIDRVLAKLPKGKRLIEPFVGSGAVFLNSNYDSYVLSDANPDLINLYLNIKNNGFSFIDFASSFFVPENNKEEAYYSLREKFNQTKDDSLKSALFIYLNRHCFNGLCRYNAKGEFNVPFGRYTAPQFPKEEIIFFKEKSHKAEIILQDFRITMGCAETGDVVYCDPPYDPLTQTSSFTSYTQGDFGRKDQEDLTRLAYILQGKAIPVVISNHNTEYTRSAYSKAELESFDVQRFISSKTKSRGCAPELIAVFA